MMYIGQIHYKMTEEEEWKSGWLVGEHINNATTILDEKFNPVPKIKEGDQEFMCWEKTNLMFSGVMIQI